MSKKVMVSLGDLGEYINGRAFKPAEWGTSGLPIVRIANLNDPKAPIDYFDGDVDNGHRIDSGDIVVSWSATLDAYLWDRGPAVLNQHIFKVVHKPKLVTNEYLFFVLKNAMKGLSDLVHGATMKHVTKPEFESFKIAITQDLEEQCQIAARLKEKLAEIEKARQAAALQSREMVALAGAIVIDSIKRSKSKKYLLGDALDEVKQGIGKLWSEYPVHGATRGGLAPAKEPPGKHPQKYKPVFPGTVFYNPMRILIGSIAFVDEDDTPGITSPDYVALQGKEGVVDSRWFYYWLRSQLGVQCITSLARGAVRERMLFNRLAEGEIELPIFTDQQNASKALATLKPMRRAIEQKLHEINLMPEKILAQAFEM